MADEILLESGGSDFILLEDGTALLLEIASEGGDGGGAGPAGSSTSKGATSLAQQQLIPKRRRILNAELHITGKAITVPLELPLRLISLLSKHQESTISLKSDLLSPQRIPLNIDAAPNVPQGIRIEITGKNIIPLSSNLSIRGNKFHPEGDIPNELYIDYLKQKAMRRFYE